MGIFTLLTSVTITVVEVAPAGKASFVYSYVQTRLTGQYNGKWPFSLVYVLKPQITAISGILQHIILPKTDICAEFTVR